jgi:8-oxo-dGTP pyrophosphatase MutT (NUDIX family)
MNNVEKLHEQGSPEICPVIVFLRDGKFLVGLRHYKSASVWTTPGGRCVEGETIEETLRREVSEEIGITEFSIEQFLGSIAGRKEGDIVYLYGGTTDQEPILCEPEKFSEWKWVTVDEIPENFINVPSLELIRNYF